MSAFGIVFILADTAFSNGKCECGAAKQAGDTVYFLVSRADFKRRAASSFRALTTFCDACIGPRYRDRIVAVAKLFADGHDDEEALKASAQLRDDYVKSVLEHMPPDERAALAVESMAITRLIDRLGIDVSAPSPETTPLAFPNPFAKAS